MEWFRHYHGLSVDPKLTSAAMTAEVHHCIAVAAWCFVLEHASSAEDRGSVADLSPKVMAIGLRIGKSEAERLIEAFRDEGLISPDGRLQAWDKRQKRSDSSAERVAEWRKRKASSGGVTGGGSLQQPDVTSQHAKRNVTKGARAESDTEQNREDQTPSSQQRFPDSALARDDVGADASPAGLLPEEAFVDELLFGQLLARLEIMGQTAATLRRRIGLLIAERGSVPLVELALRKALDRAGGDPIAYAQRIILDESTKRAAAIEAARVVATGPPEEDPNLVAHRKTMEILRRMEDENAEFSDVYSRLPH